jgi:hypothetical protein
MTSVFVTVTGKQPPAAILYAQFMSESAKYSGAYAVNRAKGRFEWRRDVGDIIYLALMFSGFVLCGLAVLLCERL